MWPYIGLLFNLISRNHSKWLVFIVVIYTLCRSYTPILEKNISSDDAVYFWSDHGIFIDNSWDREDHSWENPGSVPFINTTDPDSPDFLRPAKGSGYEDLGVYAGEK